jgi:hypothetical protein
MIRLEAYRSVLEKFIREIPDKGFPPQERNASHEEVANYA